MIALATNQGDDFAKLVGSYTLEALHALLHHVHGTANPRKSEWTRQLALFEAVQPADSRRMGMLLPEATVRDTIDEGLFIQTVASFARSIGLYEPEKEDAIARVIRPVNDLFPSQVRKLFGFRMNLPDETKDKLSDFFDRKFFDRIFAHGDAERVGSALSTALRNALRHPGEMPKICSDAWSSRSATACDLNQKLSCLNLLIEHLNLVRQHDEAIRYARIGDSEIAKDTVGAAPEILASFHNEFGSCYRYLAEYDLALEQYEISFNRTSRSPKVADVRVVLRNIAIVQRSMGQFSTARETLVKLRKDADYLERFGLLLSEAICWQSAGYWDRALSLLESHAAEIQPAAYADQNVRFYAFTLGQLLFHENRFEAALPHLEASLAAARDVNDTFFVALNECLLYRCRSAWSGSSDPAERERIIDALSPLLDGPLSLNTSTNAAVGVAHHVCELLIEDGRDGHAEEVARRLLEIRGEDSHDVWLFHLMAAELADARADWEQASKDLLAALSNLNMSIRRADPQNDPFALLSRRFRNLVRLAALLIKYEKAGLFKPAALWLCADIQTSPVLTSRLTAASAPLSAYSVDAIQGFLGTTTAMMQVIEDNDGMLMLLTTIVDGKPHVAMERLGITSREARSLDARLDYWLRLQRVNQKTLSLDEVRGWAAFQSQLSMIMRDVPAETVLHLAPGGLGMTALHCAFSERPHCFVPSMGSAIAVRARRPPVLWRPKHMFNLSVWRAGDGSYTVEAMQKASKRFEEIGQEYGVATEQAFGIEASAAALIEGLQRSDLARLACHGQVKPLEQTVDLLLAADGLLPPSVVQAYLDRRYDKNHFGWQNLKNLSSVPRMVVSSACDSGYSILNDSGERLGFDRALLRAGTTCYVAPLWPVAVDEIQDLTCSIIERYLEEPEGTIGAAVLAACRDFESHGGGQLTSRSIAVFGDFL